MVTLTAARHCAPNPDSESCTEKQLCVPLHTTRMSSKLPWRMSTSKALVAVTDSAFPGAKSVRAMTLSAKSSQVLGLHEHLICWHIESSDVACAVNSRQRRDSERMSASSQPVQLPRPGGPVLAKPTRSTCGRQVIRCGPQSTMKHPYWQSREISRDRGLSWTMMCRLQLAAKQPAPTSGPVAHWVGMHTANSLHSLSSGSISGPSCIHSSATDWACDIVCGPLKPGVPAFCMHDMAAEQHDQFLAAGGLSQRRHPRQAHWALLIQRPALREVHMEQHSGNTCTAHGDRRSTSIPCVASVRLSTSSKAGLV
jgi:hypothetical protein